MVDWESGLWDDHDEDCHGPIDADWARDEFPDGFIWSCCNETMDKSKGCKVFMHRPDRSKRVKVMKAGSVTVVD